jgi:hypothetical protein
MSERDEPMSEHLLYELEDIESGFVTDAPPEQREVMRQFSLYLGRFVDEILQSKEELTALAKSRLDLLVHTFRDSLPDLLDTEYTRRFLGMVPGCVDRTLLLVSLEAKYKPSAQTNQYIREATKAYVLGLPLASVAMSRAALEQALRDRLALQQTDERKTFDELVKDAQRWNLVSDGPRPSIREVNKRCNEVMHQKPVNKEEALELLGAARSEIERLFSTDGGF